AEDVGIVWGCSFGSQCRTRATSNDRNDTPPNQFGRQLRQSIDLILGPTVFDRDVLALDIAVILQALAKCGQYNVRERPRLAVEESNHRHWLLLRAGNERPRDGTTAEQRDELAPAARGDLPKDMIEVEVRHMLIIYVQFMIV